jgi:hypothetical protein
MAQKYMSTNVEQMKETKEFMAKEKATMTLPQQSIRPLGVVLRSFFSGWRK